jgi:hypothetical protein
MSVNGQRDPRAPAELWIFILGFAVYSVLPLLPQTPKLLGNPIPIFAAVMAFNLRQTRNKKGYWLTVTVAFLVPWYPLLVSSPWVRFDDVPTLVASLWYLVIPALLICLLFSPRVRDFAHLKPAAGGPTPAEPGARRPGR